MTNLILWIVGIVIVAFAAIFGLFGLVAANHSSQMPAPTTASY